MVTLHHKCNHMSQLEWSFRDVNNQELDSTRGYSASSSHPRLGSIPEKAVIRLFSVIPRASVLYPLPLKPTGQFLTFPGTGQGWEEWQAPREQAELRTDILLVPWWTLWCFHLSASLCCLSFSLERCSCSLDAGFSVIPGLQESDFHLQLLPDYWPESKPALHAVASQLLLRPV